MQNPPWLSWETQDSRPVPGTYKGFLYDVIVALAQQMKINFTIDNDVTAKFGPGMNLTETELEREMNVLFESDVVSWCRIYLLLQLSNQPLEGDAVESTNKIFSRKLVSGNLRVFSNF